MTARSLVSRAGRNVALGLGAAAGAYAAYAGVTWLRYGKVKPPRAGETDTLLDVFMPHYEVVERHRVFVKAPADTTFAALCRLDFDRSPIIHAIFKARELVLGSDPGAGDRPHGLVAMARAIGWGELGEIDGREVAFGAVTRPWEADVTFHPLPPQVFAAFDEPNYVKIAWTLRADPVGQRYAVARSETRAVATDAGARAHFRRYWSMFSPGIELIRVAALTLVKHDAERDAGGQHG